MMASSNLAIGMRATALVMGATAICVLIQNVAVLTAVSVFATPTDASIFQEMFPLLTDAPWRIAIIFACFLLVGGKADWLWPGTFSWRKLMLAFALGAAFSAIVNGTAHKLLYDMFGIAFLKDDAVEALPSARQVLIYGFIGIVLAPLAEELSTRGLLFAETKTLPRIQVFIWSIIVFALMHILLLGTAKVLAVIPMAILFVAVRHIMGNWIYSAAAHSAVNLIAILEIDVFAHS